MQLSAARGLLALWAFHECVFISYALKCGTGAKFIPIHCPSDNLMVMKITEANSNSWNEDQECVSFHGIEMSCYVWTGFYRGSFLKSTGVPGSGVPDGCKVFITGGGCTARSVCNETCHAAAQAISPTMDRPPACDCREASKTPSSTQLPTLTPTEQLVTQPTPIPSLMRAHNPEESSHHKNKHNIKDEGQDDARAGESDQSSFPKDTSRSDGELMMMSAREVAVQQKKQEQSNINDPHKQVQSRQYIITVAAGCFLAACAMLAVIVIGWRRRDMSVSVSSLSSGQAEAEWQVTTPAPISSIALSSNV